MLSSLIINGQKAYYFTSREFEIGGSMFEIVASEITGAGVHDAMHTIKNKGTGLMRDLPMPRLISLITHYKTKENENDKKKAPR